MTKNKYVEEKVNDNGVVAYQKDSIGNQFWYSDTGYLVHELSYTGLERWYNTEGFCIRMYTPNENEETVWYDPPAFNSDHTESFRMTTESNGGFGKKLVHCCYTNGNSVEKSGFAKDL